MFKRIGRILFVAVLALGLFAAPSQAAFSSAKLTRLSGGGDANPQAWAYKDTSATIATLIAADYLVPGTGLLQALTAGDLVYVTGSDGQALVVVVSATATADVVTRFSGSNNIQVSTTFDPAATVDGAGVTSSSITTTGAALGDFCEVAAPYDLAGQTVNCYVDATDSVKIRVQNESGTNTDNASGTWKIRVKK